MRKAIPCVQCGVAKLHAKDAEYIIGCVPAKLMIPGGVFTWKCFCGRRGKMNRSQFNALPNLAEKKEE